MCVPKSETLNNFFLEGGAIDQIGRIGRIGILGKKGKWGKWRKWGNNNKVYRILGQGCYIFVA